MAVRTDLDQTWLPIPDVAEKLGLQLRDVRNLVRDGEAVAVRVDGLEGARIPSAFLGRREGDLFVDGLRGSITQLRDAGLSDDELVEWLLSPNDELGTTPAEALGRGLKHAVRRAAIALA